MSAIRRAKSSYVPTARVALDPILELVAAPGVVLERSEAAGRK